MSETRPGEGERSAITGYHAQYRVAASLIYRALRQGSLEWIRVADPEAARVDDLQIGSPLRVDAFQVRWSRYGRNITFNDLIHRDPDDSCLISDLADGRRILQEVHPSSRVVVHFVTNNRASVSDILPLAQTTHRPRHFAAFIDQAWIPAHRMAGDTESSVPERWRPAWEQLQSASGLLKPCFEEFVRDCELELGYRVPESDMITTRDQESAQRDLRHLTQSLFATVADAEQIIELSYDELINRLGWRERLEFRSSHKFPEPAIPYYPIEATAQNLEECLSKNRGGYIALLGTPGSGKSTFLSQFFRQRNDRVVHYYSYVPDATEPLTLRGESENFLHDVVRSLERAGFSEGESISQFDRLKLMERLHAQLQLLHNDWLQTNRRTVILVDGLDHIAREQNPHRSLLLDLPVPEQIPEGVYFVLGSQTDQLRELPDRVQHQIQQQSRRVRMGRLRREAVAWIIENSEGHSNLSEGHQDEIYARSDGHPLALVYLLNRLKGVSEAGMVESILQSTDRYEDDISSQYHSYWRQLEDDRDLLHLLGMLSRLRGPIVLPWVETWASPTLIDRLRRQLEHYFRVEDHRRWYFFHNSFRLFLLDKTAESSPGTVDPSRNSELHRELAEIFAGAGDEVYGSSEELYHLGMAGEHEAVLTLATQEWFRNQFLSFRPLSAIYSDIKLALQSAVACTDYIALARLVLVGAEMARRDFYLEDVPIISTLHAFGDHEIVIDHLRDGNRLRVDPSEALRMVNDLRSAGLNEEATRMFELAEPLELLTAETPVENDFDGENIRHLEAWAGAAIHFRDLAYIIETISGLRLEEDSFRHIDAECATDLLQEKMLFHTGLSLLEDRRWEDFAMVISQFQKDHHSEQRYWFWLNVHAWQMCLAAGQQQAAREFIEDTFQEATLSELEDEERVILAEGVYRVIGDVERSQELIRNVPQPTLATNENSAGSSVDQMTALFRFYRLHYAFGENRSLTDIVPCPEDPRKEGAVYLERAICVIAEIWADAWCDRELELSSLRHNVLSLMRLFNRPWKETERWQGWHQVQRSRDHFYDLLINAVAEHGAEAVESLRIEIEKEWEGSATRNFWPSNVRRSLILSFWHVGVEESWVIEKLNALEHDMFEGADPADRVTECHAQAEAWERIGDISSARRLLRQTLEVGIGVEYQKDYQMDIWVEWLERANAFDPERAVERVEWFARAIKALETTTEGRASASAANELLAVSFRWSPRSAVRLFRWFIEQGIVSHEDALYVLLREALKSGDPPVELVLIILVDFLMLIATDVDSELADALVSCAAADENPDVVARVGQDLIAKIHLYALPSKRPEWRHAIAQSFRRLRLDLEAVGLSQADLQPVRRDTSSPEPLRFKDDSSEMSMDEVAAHIHSVPDIQKLLETESEDSGFRWDHLINQISHRFNQPDIGMLANLFEGRRRSSQILATLSETLHGIGDISGAWSLGERALEASEPFGWDRWYDGGSRLLAFKALAHADVSRARPLLFETLVRDFAITYWYPGRIALNLHELLAVLHDEDSAQGIWAEVEKHVKILFKGSSMPENGPTGLGSEFPQDTACTAITALLLSHLDHPANEVIQAAQRAFGALLLGRVCIDEDVVLEFLRTPGIYQEKILMVFEAVSQMDSAALENYTEAVARLHQSRNYATRHAVQIICGRMGLEVPVQENIPRQLPSTYELQLPDSRDSMAITSREDPLEVMKPLRYQIKCIAEEADLSQINICHRAFQLMRELAPEETWSKAADEKVEAMLGATGVRLKYYLPRALLARRALFHVVAELYDAGVFDDTNLNRLEEALRFYDPKLILRQPSSRPPEICPIRGRYKHGENNEQWLDQIEESVSALVSVTDQQLLFLAEETNLKCLDRDAATEIRCSVVCSSEASENISDEAPLFCALTGCLLTEYPKLLIHEDPMPLIIRHDAYYYDSPGTTWLALNPAVGLKLGWTLEEEGLFRWADSQGQLMVETFWWVDGLLGQAPIYFHDEVGEGWLVLASQEGCKQIEKLLGTSKRLLTVERKYYDPNIGKWHAKRWASGGALNAAQ